MAETPLPIPPIEFLQNDDTASQTVGNPSDNTTAIIPPVTSLSDSGISVADALPLADAGLLFEERQLVAVYSDIDVPIRPLSMCYTAAGGTTKHVQDHLSFLLESSLSDVTVMGAYETVVYMWEEVEVSWLSQDIELGPVSSFSRALVDMQLTNIFNRIFQCSTDHRGILPGQRLGNSGQLVRSYQRTRRFQTCAQCSGSGFLVRTPTFALLKMVALLPTGPNFGVLVKTALSFS